MGAADAEETESQAAAAAEADTGLLSSERGVPATRSARVMEAERRSVGTVESAAAMELQANNATELLGRDRRKPQSLQLFMCGRDKAATGQFLSLAEDWCEQFRCCWVDCDSEPAWATFIKRLRNMDASTTPESSSNDELEGTRASEVELVLWRKGGLQCARFAGSNHAVQAWDEWIRGVRMGEVEPQWHTLRADPETELPHWPSFASEFEGSDDDETGTSETDSEDPP